MKKILDSRVFDIVSSIIETIIAISLIILIILVGFQRFSSRGNLFGYRIYTIASGSMIPTYVIGDTLLIKEMSSSNIHVGDAVTYMGEAGGVDGMIITHQVQEVDIDENGKYSFHTKGIANNIEDPIVYEDQVLGKVVHKFLLLSIIGRVTTSMPLLFTFVTIPVAILIAIEIIKIVYKKNDDDEDDEDDEITDSVIEEIDEDEDDEEVLPEEDVLEVQEEFATEEEKEIEPSPEVQISNEEIINELREMGLKKEKVQEEPEEHIEEVSNAEIASEENVTEEISSEDSVVKEENEEQKAKKKRRRKKS